jgi:hypothetical protein
MAAITPTQLSSMVFLYFSSIDKHASFQAHAPDARRQSTPEQQQAETVENLKSSYTER